LNTKDMAWQVANHFTSLELAAKSMATVLEMIQSGTLDGIGLQSSIEMVLTQYRTIAEAAGAQ